MSTLRTKLLNTAARLKTFRRREDGATMVEFALLALPFFIMLLGIIELAIIFFLNSALQNATHEASRQIRVGAFSGTEKDFENLICGQLNPGATNDGELAPCREKLTISVVGLDDFGAVAFGSGPARDPDDPLAATSGGETVLVRAVYRFKLVTPGQWTRLSNVPNKNERDLRAVSAFRNEPF